MNPTVCTAVLLLMVIVGAITLVSADKDDYSNPKPTKTVLSKEDIGLDGTESEEEQRAKMDAIVRKHIKGETVYFKQGTGPEEFRQATENIVIGGDSSKKGDDKPKGEPAKTEAAKPKKKKTKKKTPKKKVPTRPGHGPGPSDGRPDPRFQFNQSFWDDETDEKEKPKEKEETKEEQKPKEEPKKTEKKTKARKKRATDPIKGLPSDPEEFFRDLDDAKGTRRPNARLDPESLKDFAPVDPEEFRLKERERLDKMYGKPEGVTEQEITPELQKKLRDGRKAYLERLKKAREAEIEKEEEEQRKRDAELYRQRAEELKAKQEEEARKKARLCPEHLFQCKTGECILPIRECDGKKDCVDGSDEDDCLKGRASRRGKVETDVPDDFVCPHKLFTCHNKECVLPTYRCNGSVECSDGSDEWDCKDEL